MSCELTADVCVVGAGPAGVIVALEYARRRPDRRVLLLEYGRPGAPARNGLDDTIRNLNPTNHHDPYDCTNKGLGGTSATWGGRCVMYDAVDFTDRPAYRGECTWDESFLRETEPYVGAAQAYFECEGGGFTLTGRAAERRIAEGFVPGDVTDTALERWSLPTRFGPRYRAELAATRNLTVAEGVEARSFPAPDGKGRVTEMAARVTATGQAVRVRAGRYVLAAGGQETTRLLLRSPAMFAGRGGPPDALGRYYQSHVSGKIAGVRFRGDPRKTDFFFGRDGEGCYYRRRFQLSREAIVRENLLNAAVWLDNPLYHDPGHGNGAMSFMYLMMVTPWLGSRLAPPALAKAFTQGRAHRVGAHVGNVLAGLPGSLTVPAEIFVRRYCLRRKLPGIFLYSPRNEYALHFHAEQVPDRESRMTLGADGETLEIRYGIRDEDVASVLRTHELIDGWLRRSGCGELAYWQPEGERAAAVRRVSRDGIHQNGTTRIADRPERGVVDRDLRVWGTENVYVCSSSAFPTSGQANPTFFTGVCAVRLARKLAGDDADG
ncbi:MAG: GMC oxidoreductase [Planctomycetia bacterium]